jgi:transcriptional regulator with XRE-family HTH domain
MSASGSPVGADFDEPLPARLRRFREQSGLSRSELAERTGLSRPTIWAWESGRTQPRQSNLHTLANALGISEVELVGASGAMFQRGEFDGLGSSPWQSGEIPDGVANAQRLRIMIYAARLGIAALAGIKAQNVKISIEL